MLEVLTTLCGVLCDPGKDEDTSLRMVAHGMSIEWCMAFEHVQVRLELGKAQQWLAAFVEASGLDELQAELACMMAGRLQWFLTASPSRAGRSYLKAGAIKQAAPSRSNVTSSPCGLQVDMSIFVDEAGFSLKVY